MTMYIFTAEQFRGRLTLTAPHNPKVVDVVRYGKAGAEASGRPEGSVMIVRFTLDGQEFIALNGGPEFQFTEAVSLMVSCTNQEEIDWFWDRLSEGGEQGPCGWLKDRYGLSWQVTPIALLEMQRDEDPERAERVMSAMLQMKSAIRLCCWLSTIPPSHIRAAAKTHARFRT